MQGIHTGENSDNRDYLSHILCAQQGYSIQYVTGSVHQYADVNNKISVNDLFLNKYIY